MSSEPDPRQGAARPQPLPARARVRDRLRRPDDGLRHGATQIGTGGEATVRDLLVAAFGCNIAWGMIDAAMFLLQQQFGRFRTHRTMRELQVLTDDERFRASVREELPPLIGPALTPETFAGIRRARRDLCAPRARRFWSREEFAAAALIWLLVSRLDAAARRPFPRACSRRAASPCACRRRWPWRCCSSSAGGSAAGRGRRRAARGWCWRWQACCCRWRASRWAGEPRAICGGGGGGGGGGVGGGGGGGGGGGWGLGAGGVGAPLR